MPIKFQQMNVMLFRSFGLLHVILLIATTLNVANAGLSKKQNRGSGSGDLVLGATREYLGGENRRSIMLPWESQPYSPLPDPLCGTRVNIVQFVFYWIEYNISMALAPFRVC